MLRLRATSIRGQLVAWYLGVLAVLLLALGGFQWYILGSHLRSSLAENMRQAARAELAVLGPCYIRSSSDLHSNAPGLAQLLGSHDTAVKIVTTTGATLADHGLGPPGATRPLSLSAGTIRGLIQSASLGRQATVASHPATRCRESHLRYHGTSSGGHAVPPVTYPFTVGPNDLLLLSVPLGPRGGPVGYAILGHSLADVNATLQQVVGVFALGAGLALLLAALVALPTINRALHPLRRVASAAEAIAAGDIGQRANLDHSRDEIGRLGAAFDTMVDRLQSALFAATDSEDRMRQFLADASHELRTPVTVLRGASQVLLRRGLDGPPDLAAALSDMHDEAVRLSNLVDDLLALSRIDAGQSLAPESVNVDAFLRQFRERYAPAWPARSIVIAEGSTDGALAFVDPEALRRVVTNLVDNAARYSRPGGSISLKSIADVNAVSLVVSDEGPGMTLEDANRAFDRFYRAGKSRSRNSGGTGLGLAIVQGLVEESKGRVQIATGPDRGTSVTVSLPRAAQSIPDTPDRAGSHRSEPASGAA